MLKSNLKRTLILAAAVLVTAAASAFSQETNEAELLGVLRSDATLQEKSTACRQLVRIATKESVPTLAGLLGDEHLSHMARYALEAIRDASVDDALREALGRVQGQPRLGVIGSLGARRDAKAVDALAGLLRDADAAQSAARALGSIGTAQAAAALEASLPGATGGNQLAICEGLLRCAELLAADGEDAASQAIYDRLRGLADAPPQVAAAALRGAILARGKDGVPLLVQAIHGPDYALAAAAVRTAMESTDAEISDALLAELPKASAERQGLLILALADRGESRVLPIVLRAAQSGDGQLRILAFRALKQVGDASCIPALLDAAAGDSAEVSQAAMESLESLQDKSVDGQVAAELEKAQGKMRLVLLELVARRRTAAAAPALWRAADDTEPAVRAAALAGLGAVLETADLPKLIARLADTRQEPEAAALDKALREVGLRSADRNAVAAQLVAALPTVDGSVQARVLETLNVIGGATALEAVAAAARSSDEAFRDAAFRVLGQWRSADAAPVLLDLHNGASDERFKIRAIRAYIRIARQFDMPAEDRATMCRTALELAGRDEDKRLVMEVLLRYPSEEMQAIALEAAKNPALKEEALLVVMGMASKGINRAELGRALAQAGQTPVKLEIVKAEYGAGENMKDVTEILRKHAKGYRILFLPNASYNESFGGDPAQGIVKQLKIQYRIDGKEAEVSLSENAMIVLPLPK
ncbi:MAG: HEAT repeat domain-containing protein [Pirellulaceae bacterium]|nr:HEAT repeat domain-containing protein [Pirellulaceae bacterium]